LIKSFLYGLGFFQWIYWILKSLELNEFKIPTYNIAWNGGKHEGKTLLTYKLPGPHPIGGCVAGGVWETMFNCLLRAE
jgi:hypothetical protein